MADEPTVEDQILGEVKTIRSTTDQLTQNFDNLDKSTKKDFEDLRKSIANDKASVEERLRSIQKVNASLARESRAAFGDPRQRILADDEKKARLFASVALALAPEHPKLRDVATNILKDIGEDATPGSTYIDDELIPDVYDALLRYGAWSSLGVRNMGTKQAKIPVKTARPVANFILTEGGAISADSTKAGTTATLEAEVIAVLLSASRQLLDDAELDVVADILDDFIEAVNLRMDYGCFVGDGTADATHGGITGVFEFGTGVAADATRTTIAATKYTDWLKCLTGVDAAVLARPACWWMHPSIAAAAIGVKDDNGRPIFQTAQEAPMGGVLSMFGYPVKLVGTAPSTDAANNKIAAFGDPRAFAVGMRKGFEFDRSEHYAFNTYEHTFRGIARGDGIGLDASALTVLSTPAS